MSWTKHIKHPSELFKKGQKVEAVVLRIDKEKERLSLGYKQLRNDPWDDEIPNRNAVGDVAGWKANKGTHLGVFVEMDRGDEGVASTTQRRPRPRRPPEEKNTPRDEGR